MTAALRQPWSSWLTAGLAVCLLAACMGQEAGDAAPDASAAPEPGTATEEPVTLDHEQAQAHRQLGFGLEAAGDIDGAVNEFRAAIRMGEWPPPGPDGADDDTPYGDLARICNMGEPAAPVVRACSTLVGSFRYRSDTLAAFLANRGDANLRLGETGLALANYEAALKIVGEQARALYGRGTLRARTGDHRGALSDYARAVSASPDMLEVRIARARLLESTGDVEGALADLDHVLAEPGGIAAYPGAYRDRARLHCLTGQADAAAIGWQVWLAGKQDGAAYVQEMLRAHGFMRGPIGGDFHPAALAALRAWTDAGCPGESLGAASVS